MKFKIVDKQDVMSMLENDNLYLLRVSHKEDRKNTKYCSSKQVQSLNVKEVIDAISESNTAFIQIIEES